MLWFFDSFFPVVWIAFIVYWQVRSFGTKGTQRLEPAGSRIVRAVLLLTVIAIVSLHHIPLRWLYRHLWPADIWSFGIGAVVTVIGLGFAIWARQHLSSNWSSAVTIKQGHELIVTGPYARVRHPIYTGILTGFLGTAIALAEVRGFVGLVLMFFLFWAKLRIEEKWMRSEFGETYATYEQRTAALVPYVF